MAEEKQDTKKCKHCQTDIPLKAKKCPNCQGDLRSWFRRHPVLTVIGVLIVLGIVGSAAGGESKIGNSTGKEEKSVAESVDQQQGEKEEILEVDTKSFVAEFDENQLAAETKYEDKLVKFTGYIDNISEGIMGEYYVIIQPTADEYYMGTSIQCYFDNKEDLLSLKNGQKVTLRGKIDTQMMNVLVKSCEVVD